MPALAYPVPANEPARLASLASSRLLEDGQNARFDRVVRLAAQLTGTPIALVSLLDAHLQHLFAVEGIAPDPMLREEAFCNYTIVQDDVFVVEDATKDPRFAENPHVTGGTRIRFYAGAPLCASDGHHIGAVCVIDTTPRALSDKGRQLLLDLAAMASEELRSRKLVEEFAQADTERAGLVRALAHDLRSPLGGIAGLAELLVDLVPAHSEAADLAGTIGEAATSALSIASSTLERALGRSSTPGERSHAVDLVALMADVAVVHQPAAVAKRQRIVVEGTPAATRGDAVRLHHALANLISNALKFSPTDSTVTVRTGTDAASAWVSVEDEGPGLGDVDPVRLFEPFERGPARPTGGEPSTGLGLSIVRDLARLHGGEVRAETVPAGGARFTLSLPSCPAARPAYA